ncbi:MAG: hypothetical protein K0B07_05295 [DPANN group archaeon]|nr:hypothetical protein [DPANN group archaeon]
MQSKSCGPYFVEDGKISYIGNKVFNKIDNVKFVSPPDLSMRYKDLKNEPKKWAAIIRIFDAIFKASNKFMEHEGAYLFNLPVLTRMISSPGALNGTIPSDVEPFRIQFFEHETFLTQSSQLYLEFAINNPEIDQLYCWDKSFRMENADFRHLPEFTHIEYEGKINFKQNLDFQEKYLKFIINYLLNNNKDDLDIFLDIEDFKNLESIIKIKFDKITFHKAFDLLYKHTKNLKYKEISIKNFGAYEEILLIKILGGKPIFVIDYISDEVAFYHANHKDKPELVINADLLFPGFGEIIGSGERVHTREDTELKAKHFKLDMDDYGAYIASRDSTNPKIHSGWGMGIERFIQCLLKLPFIWETKPFPRVHNSNRP